MRSDERLATEDGFLRHLFKLYLGQRIIGRGASEHVEA
jgi:hypothetical protein